MLPRLDSNVYDDQVMPLAALKATDRSASIKVGGATLRDISQDTQEKIELSKRTSDKIHERIMASLNNAKETGRPEKS